GDRVNLLGASMAAVAFTGPRSSDCAVPQYRLKRKPYWHARSYDLISEGSSAGRSPNLAKSASRSATFREQKKHLWPRTKPVGTHNRAWRSWSLLRAMYR